MATSAQIEEFRTAQASLVSLGQAQLRDVLSTFSLSSDPAAVRDVLLRYFPDFMTAFGDTAAVIGADFYDMVRDLPPSAGSVRAVFAQPAKTKQSEGVVRWAVNGLFTAEADWEAFESLLLGAAQRLMLQPSRQTIDLLAQEDARSGRVAAVSWSRHVHPERAQSHKSCDFCIMLAGRGPIYRSQEAAGSVIGRGSDRTGFDEDGHRSAGGIGGGIRARGAQELAASFHDDCNCTTVPTFYEIQDRPGSRYPQVLAPIN
ncbi:MAG: hypothetical protein BGN97_00270 [Microbacterium sp. 69-10]|uniref:VG15 protein n=1 Tax=Microbacterium sp. 69-10 TaxID=1895783 RepID=UPI0009671FCF|nr:hypothetical protein [Microbacterium sp. 69-10]OJU39690.1 MAG: hypothetical protein BGN97_00270 [Microbacterium sp. 69-10]